MTNAAAGKPGEKRPFYCSVCEEEQTFVRGVWSGVEFYGSPPAEESGWECTVCGSRVLDP